jgi:hypothetical protein
MHDAEAAGSCGRAGRKPTPPSSTAAPCGTPPRRGLRGVQATQSSRTSSDKGMPVCAAVGGPVRAAAATTSPPHCPRLTLGCQALFRPPVGSATRSNSRCALPHLIAPRGAPKAGTGAATLCPCHGCFSPPHPRTGALPIAALLEVSSCAAPATGPLRSFLPPCTRSYCNARGLLRQGPASWRAPAGRPPRAGRQRRPEGRLGKPRCWRTTVASSACDGGQATRTRAGRGAGAGRRPAWWQACPHTPRGSLRSVVGRTVFYPGCVLPCRQQGQYSRTGSQRSCWGGWRAFCSPVHPLAAASGCRLRRRFSSSSGSAR